MTYDQWKTTDPRELEPEQEDAPTELELLFDEVRDLRAAAEREAKIASNRIKELTTALEEALEYFKDRYDIRDGEDGPRPNEEMQLGTMIDEALYGIRF